MRAAGVAPCTRRGDGWYFSFASPERSADGFSQSEPCVAKSQAKVLPFSSFVYTPSASVVMKCAGPAGG
jgi:hypothetical protein